VREGGGRREDVRGREGKEGGSEREGGGRREGARGRE
jgi:hypothetical protein